MGTRQRRQREVAQRREAILAAAKALFWKHGYTGTTMPQIAEKAELAPGTLYLYFPGKSAIYAEILAEGYEALQSRLERAVGRGGEARQRAEGLIDAFLGFARDQSGYFDIIFFILQREGGWEGNLSPEQVARIAVTERACRDVVAANLGGAAGEQDLPDALAEVDAIWSMLVGVVMFFKNDDRLDEVAAEAKRLILKATFG